MTGRDVIIYILVNNLEDELFFKDGRMLGFLTTNEAAAKFNVGRETILHWVKFGQLDGVEICGELYIPSNAEIKERKLYEEQDNSNLGRVSINGINVPCRTRSSNDDSKVRNTQYNNIYSE